MTTRLDWLRARQSGLGATDIASVAGVGFATPHEVYAEKVAAHPVDRAPSPIMRMGLATEDHNAALYAERTGFTLTSPGLVRSLLAPWAFSTFDRVVVDPADHTTPRRPVDLKYAGPFFGDRWGDDGSDEVPDGYVVQVTWQAVVLRSYGHDVREADVSALDGAGDHRVYTVPLDARLANLLVDLGEAFWRCVLDRTPPGDDWQASLGAAVRDRVAAIRPDTTVALPPEAAYLADEYENAKLCKKEAEARMGRAKAALVGHLAGSETGTLPDGRRVRQRVVERKAYTVDAASYVDFRILNPRKETREHEA